MQKLRHKVFWTLFLILTLVTVGVLGAFNAQAYRQEYHSVTEKLSQAQPGEPGAAGGNQPEKRDQDGEAPMGFLDSVVYTVLLGQDGSVGTVLNRSEDGKTDAEITALAQKYMSAGRTGTVVGNLYTAKYAYSYAAGHSITLLDLTRTGQKLRQNLVLSLGILLVAEGLILLVSRRLTRWIIEPVEESFQRQKQFVADASHELKTPLAVIMAGCDALEQSPGDPKYLGYIADETRQMQTLVTQLLDLAQVSEQPPVRETVDLSALTGTTVLSFEALLFERQITLEEQIEPGLWVQGDSDQLRRVITVLTENALHHGRPGTAVQVRLHGKGTRAVLQVENTGDPIPPGEEQRIFERFYRADTARNRESGRYGLGLAIAKGIVEGHGGTIVAASTGEQTVFTVSLPTEKPKIDKA